MSTVRTSRSAVRAITAVGALVAVWVAFSAALPAVTTPLATRRQVITEATTMSAGRNVVPHGCIKFTPSRILQRFVDLPALLYAFTPHPGIAVVSPAVVHDHVRTASAPQNVWQPVVGESYAVAAS